MLVFIKNLCVNNHNVLVKHQNNHVLLKLPFLRVKKDG